MQFIGCLQIAHRTWVIILANYVSMMIGLEYIAPYFSTISGNRDFWGGQTNYGDYHLVGFVAGMATAFIATLIIEFPFFYFSLKDKSDRGQMIYPYLTANFATNSAMFVIYLLIVTPGSS
jgi:hypothetical protein